MKKQRDKRNKDMIYLGISGLIVWLIIGAVFNDILKALKFGVVYWYLFFFPYLTWTSLLDLSFIEKFIICNIIGLVVCPTLWFILSMIGVPLNKFIYILIPLLVFLGGLGVCLMRMKK
ncbi:hypothetical protein JXB41_00285 [Candidatus Woesearchaeota archaeon]|nr:hypothetical protein [Candidatus Woesearchaeota archaeon]